MWWRWGGGSVLGGDHLNHFGAGIAEFVVVVDAIDVHWPGVDDEVFDVFDGFQFEEREDFAEG